MTEFKVTLTLFGEADDEDTARRIAETLAIHRNDDGEPIESVIVDDVEQAD